VCVTGGPAALVLLSTLIDRPQLNQGSAGQNHNGIPHDRRAIDRGIPNRHIGFQQDIRMKFVLVNDRTPRPQSFCARCGEPIGRAYLRESWGRSPIVSDAESQGARRRDLDAGGGAGDVLSAARDVPYLLGFRVIKEVNQDHA
jgi:hypothetical protein